MNNKRILLILLITTSAVFSTYASISEQLNTNQLAYDETINIISRQWEWEFTYENGTAAINELHLIVNRIYRFNVVGVNVTHSMKIAEVGIDPPIEVGVFYSINVQFLNIGKFLIPCNIFCGSGTGGSHGTMKADVFVSADPNTVTTTSSDSSQNTSNGSLATVTVTEPTTVIQNVTVYEATTVKETSIKSVLETATETYTQEFSIMAFQIVSLVLLVITLIVRKYR
ncbi:MAG: hypothetical protein ACXAB7_06820 [Candidatus Kariarchaeaceae archaeon]|jgi:heme/copper-type cytochrome/quinol oxidase subunit 2